MCEVINRTNPFKKGDIIQGEKHKPHQAYHFIIYLDGSNDIPVGAVFTHSDSDEYACNKLMKSEHFTEPEKWFNNERKSYLIAHKFQKLEEWGDYHPKGKLTNTGLQFVEELVGHLVPEPYSEYEERTNRGKNCQLHKS